MVACPYLEDVLVELLEDDGIVVEVSLAARRRVRHRQLFGREGDGSHGLLEHDGRVDALILRVGPVLLRMLLLKHNQDARALVGLLALVQPLVGRGSEAGCVCRAVAG